MVVVARVEALQSSLDQIPVDTSGGTRTASRRGALAGLGWRRTSTCAWALWNAHGNGADGTTNALFVADGSLGGCGGFVTAAAVTSRADGRSLRRGRRLHAAALAASLACALLQFDGNLVLNGHTVHDVTGIDPSQPHRGVECNIGQGSVLFRHKGHKTSGMLQIESSLSHNDTLSKELSCQALARGHLVKKWNGRHAPIATGRSKEDVGLPNFGNQTRE